MFPRLHTARPVSRSHSTDFGNIRHELENMRNKLANLEEKFTNDFPTNENDDGARKLEQTINNLEKKLIVIKEQQKMLDRKHDEEKQRVDELYRQTKPHDSVTVSVEIDKPPIEPDNQIYTTVRELSNRILTLETSVRQPSIEFVQETVDQAIKISEKKAMERDRNIEKVVRSLDDKIKKMDIQLNELLTKFEKLPTYMAFADAHQLIEHELQNFVQSQPKTDEGHELAKEAINRIDVIQNQLNEYIQSNENKIMPPLILEVVQPPVVTEQPVPEPNNNFEERLNQFESRLNNIRLPSNLDLIEQRLLQLENYARESNEPAIPAQDEQVKENNEEPDPNEEQFNLLKRHINELDRRKPEWQGIEQTLNKMEQRLQEELEKNYNMLLNLLKPKPDFQNVTELIQKSEKQINQQINLLQKRFNENQRAAKNTDNDSTEHRHRKTQRFSPTKPKSQEESTTTDKPASKELQAIMPFIESLPTFDLFNENEWI